MSTYRLKGTSGPVLNQVFPLAGSVVIGSDPDCGIHATEAGVAPRHAELSLDAEGALVLRHLASGHETLCNGVAVDQKALSPGDEIRIGPCRWLLQAPGLRPDRVLTEETVRPRRPMWPWLLPVGLLLAALLAWRNGWLPF